MLIKRFVIQLVETIEDDDLNLKQTVFHPLKQEAIISQDVLKMCPDKVAVETMVFDNLVDSFKQSCKEALGIGT